jgi:hypothetical protein
MFEEEQRVGLMSRLYRQLGFFLHRKGRVVFNAA